MTVDPDADVEVERADPGLWTLAELPGQVAALLADNYEGQTSGRVGELPTGRSIRWYTTIGLVDRPVATRGRVALYGFRHVLQLAAIKKLQSEGRSLAEIQQRLVGAPDGQLADLVGATHPVAVPAITHDAVPAEFWKRGVPGRPVAPPAAAPVVSVREDSARNGDLTGDDADAGVGRARADTLAVVPAVRLGDSVMLVLGAAPRTPSADDVAAIAAAAVPLLDLLARLGLASDAGSPAPVQIRDR